METISLTYPFFIVSILDSGRQGNQSN